MERGPGSFWSLSVIVPSLCTVSKPEDRIHRCTHISLRCTSITLSHPFSYLPNSSLLSFLYLCLTSLCLLQPLCFFSSTRSLFSRFNSISLSCLPWMSDSLMNEMPFHQDASTAVTQNNVCWLVCEIPLWIGPLSVSPERLLKDS